MPLKHLSSNCNIITLFYCLTIEQFLIHGLISQCLIASTIFVIVRMVTTISVTTTSLDCLIKLPCQMYFTSIRITLSFTTSWSRKKSQFCLTRNCACLILLKRDSMSQFELSAWLFLLTYSAQIWQILLPVYHRPSKMPSAFIYFLVKNDCLVTILHEFIVKCVWNFFLPIHTCSRLLWHDR